MNIGPNPRFKAAYYRNNVNRYANQETQNGIELR